MCVAIHAPAKAGLIPFSDFELMRQANEDGMGLMWAEEGKLKVVRQLRRLRRFWGRYKALHEAGKDVVIHFRLATHGDTSMRNVHPFHVNARLAVVHNGILDGFSQHDVRSDTRQFVDSILKQLPNDWYKQKDDAIWETISTLTWGSKMIFMDSDGMVRIMHEKSGYKEQGNWFSTHSWKWSYAHDFHLMRGLEGWWDRHEERFKERVNLPPTFSSTHATTDTVVPWSGERASDAYLHWPSSEVVCIECRRMLMPNEPHYHFNTLWNDKEPIVCDLCDKCVNQDELIAMYGVGATVMEEAP